MKPITINITNLIGEIKIDNKRNDASEKIEEKIYSTLSKAIQKVRIAPKDITTKPKDTFKIKAKEIWSDNEADFNAQLEKLKAEIVEPKKLTISKHFFAVCLISS